MQVDYIIVGNGLAGACLALQLHAQGKKLAVFDAPARNRSSALAAGLFNPITGKQMKKTWQADVLFPYLHRFYRDAETTLQQKFFFPVGIYRPFLSGWEQNEWMALSGESGFANHLEVVLGSRQDLPVNDAFGGLMLREAGYVHVAAFLAAVRALLHRDHHYVEEGFHYPDLAFGDHSVSYRNHVASRIIFCEGLQALQNPWLAQIPLKPLKGEVLLVEADLPVAPIINRGVYLVPQNNQGLFKGGATYSPKDRTEQITPEARVELSSQLEALLRVPFKVVGQEWGFRPTVPDRRPIIGCHPQHEQIVVFNGLGTKGVSLAPYFSKRLADWLQTQESLPPEISMNRFYPLYSN
jgi:glycine/D-amino acid oxidase-like deaminating enzyme